MKGTFFKRPIEYRLETAGESWKQGTTIQGHLRWKSMTSGAAPASTPVVVLAQASLKQVHKKSADAFEVLSKTKATSVGETGEFAWSFALDQNAPITDHLDSLFLLYGEGDAVHELGHLQLKVTPDAMIQNLLDLIPLHFRFLLKTLKAGKKGVEAKFAPPEGNKAFVSLEHVTLSLRYETNEALALHYAFARKKIEASATTFSGMTMTKEKKELTQSFTRAQFQLANGRLNEDALIPHLREALGIPAA